MVKAVGCLALLSILAACGVGEGEGAPPADVAGDPSVPDPGASTPSAPEPPPGDPSPAPGPTKKGAPYPIVLAHGFFGFETLAGIDALTYFFGVKDELARQGEVKVFTPAVDPFNDSTTRGAQLLAEIHKITTLTGSAKVNIIAHSQGGLDARVVAHDRPDLVASVVTYATPHAGMALSDSAFSAAPGSVPGDVLDAVVKIFGAPLWDEVGNETSIAKAMKQFSTASMADFNAKYTDAPGVKYFSLTGRSGLSDGGDACKVSDSPAWITKWTGERDPINALLLGAWTLNGGLSKVNDGLVPAASARWGKFLGCVPADHFDQIGQIAGQGPGLGNSFAYKELFVSLVKHLRAAGL